MVCYVALVLRFAHLSCIYNNHAGTQALFVSKYRCLPVDASKLKTVVEGSIYYADYSMIVAHDNKIFQDDGWVEKQPEHVVEFDPNQEDYDRPFSLAQIMVDYCRSAEQE